MESIIKLEIKTFGDHNVLADKISAIIKEYYIEYCKTKSCINSYKDIKSFEDACQYLKVTPESIIKNQTEQRFINQLKLETIIKSLNEGWKPNFNDNNQKKYYNYFKMENGSFVFCDTTYYYRLMSVPSALYLKDEQTAIYCKDNFFDLYKEYYGC